MDEEENNKNLHEIVVVGNSGVGKTSLIMRFCTASFALNSDTTQTMNVDCKTIEKQIDGVVYKLQIWDTVGDKYIGATSFVLKKPSVGAYILAFDLGNEESFNDLKTWEEKLPSDRVRVLVGTHNDEPPVVSDELIDYLKNFISKCGNQYSTDPKYFSISSKTGDNVDAVFTSIVQVLVRKKKGQQDKSSVSVGSSSGNQKKKSKC